jgi:hypothetical protein
VQWTTLDAAAAGNEEARKYVFGWVAHELHHSVDNYRNSNDRMFYISMESPRLAMSFNDGKFSGDSDLSAEVLDAWNGDSSVPDGVRQYLSYPMTQAQSMAKDGHAEEAQAFAKVELFAQMGAMYVANPAMMEKYFPQWFGFFKEWSDARGTGSIERSRVTLRNILSKPVSDSRASSSERGKSLPAGSLNASDGGGILGKGGPRVGVDDPARGVGRVQPVLQTKNEAALRAAVAKAWHKSKAPSDNHIPTHVN